MPELPEVETVVRDLVRSGLIGSEVRDLVLGWPGLLEITSPTEFRRQVTGRRFLAVQRRGKYIVLQLTGHHTLLVHLRMTGRLAVLPAQAGRDAHDHAILVLDKGRELRFRDTRKFGRWIWTAAPETVLDRLGPEPLSREFRCAHFLRMLERRAAMLKPLLLDQRFIAGIGNIYADEALWRARLHPCRTAASLTHREAARLYASIRAVLQSGVRHAGTSLGSTSTNFHRADGGEGGNQRYLRVFRRTGKPCPRCGHPIHRFRVSQRSTHVCLICQPDPHGASAS
jgi:formamidopyrimidine-DNA glycosylase